MFYGRAIKIILDFEVEFFAHCSIALEYIEVF
jgi:hypothetical protein